MNSCKFCSITHDAAALKLLPTEIFSIVYTISLEILNFMLVLSFVAFKFCRFPVEDHSMKSVVDYFQEMYGFAIEYTHLPSLQVGNQTKVKYLPMEVVFLHCNTSIFLFPVALHSCG